MRFSTLVFVKGFLCLSSLLLLPTTKGHPHCGDDVDDDEYGAACVSACANLADPESPLFDFVADCTSSITVTVPVDQDRRTRRLPSAVPKGTESPTAVCDCPCETCIITDLDVVRGRRDLTSQGDGTEEYAPEKLTKEVLSRLSMEIRESREKSDVGDNETPSKPRKLFIGSILDWIFGGGDDDDDDDDGPNYPRIEIFAKECNVLPETFIDPPEPPPEGQTRFCDFDDLLDEYYGFGGGIGGGGGD